ncbi:fluoride efflux transporter CrcB [Gordonia sp. (in: high G+C Gram-positive bacteria)]|uniref:fluoride efflux transporter CrcB n=1 Tax=Gordonia sp. (in: high G+C Gram-positive bacteria) TaxID=84139 RepID=UPI00169DD1F6|nr:fluoride efflux transporter CrcB [Gordonia sp. (in: high G+C Gram-positive bacteria)]NLG46910.1 fluoride efflux transporter CrcB [Gordonia sp. (in: high G+C Gram-positive bacteria)]
MAGTANRAGARRADPPFALMPWVFAGGMLGAPARYAVESALPGVDGGFPVATFTVNVVGAFVLGLVLESLALAGPDAGIRKRLRLLIGTGFLGAFTTYSSFAVEINLLTTSDRMGVAAAYAASSLVVGLVSVALGIGAAHTARRRSEGVA